MVLTIDVGNSNIVFGGYKEGRICFLSRVSTGRSMEADELAVQFSALLRLHNLQGTAISGVAIASVVPSLTPNLVRALAYFTDAVPHILTLEDAAGLRVNIDNPKELGMDILASAIAVQSTRSLPAVIIDMGTATKLTAINAEGNLEGVAIAPGLYVSLQALVNNAAMLGNIPLEAPKNAVGRNTAESMKSGVVLGSAGMLDGMIDRFEREIGPLATVVATGGAAQVVVPHCRRDIEICETLLLDGLFHVLSRP